MPTRRLPCIGVLLAALAALAGGARLPPLLAAQSLARPAPLSDAEFWRLVTDLSETGGTFPQQLMSNEDSAQAVIPALKRTIPAGGVYIGVGSEQNFTYIAALRPRLAFIVDIRPENALEMLMYKALFELSPDRGTFVSRLFSRPAQTGVGATSTVTALFDRYAAVPSSASLLDETDGRIIEILVERHHFTLTAPERSTIASMMQRFMTAGPRALKGFGDLNPAFADLMTAGDFDGHQQSFLASEEAYAAVRTLQRQNLVVPVVGDFAGDKALKSIAEYLGAHQAAVRVFYLSNVERYLFEQAPRSRQFYANVASLPREPGSVFIRSVTRDISARLGIALPDEPTKWWTVIAPIAEDLDGLDAGRIRTYADLFKK